MRPKSRLLEEDTDSMQSDKTSLELAREVIAAERDNIKGESKEQWKQGWADE